VALFSTIKIPTGGLLLEYQKQRVQAGRRSQFAYCFSLVETADRIILPFYEIPFQSPTCDYLKCVSFAVNQCPTYRQLRERV
jgi:hypothetical protein